MKKEIALFLSMILGLVLVGCAGRNNGSNTEGVQKAQEGAEDTTTVSEEDSEPVEDVPEMSGEGVSGQGNAGGSHILIAYFSVPEDVDTSGTDAVAGASVVVRDGEKLGNTEYVAWLIQETIGGDLFRIETVEPYPLDHEPLVDQAADEQDDGLRPELATHVENFDQYEYVFLGYPKMEYGFNCV